MAENGQKNTSRGGGQVAEVWCPPHPPRKENPEGGMGELSFEDRHSFEYGQIYWRWMDRHDLLTKVKEQDQ